MSERTCIHGRTERQKCTKCPVILPGFKPLKPGKIHLRCYECHRLRSNMRREEGDPPTAVVAEILCPKCCDDLGAMEPETSYLNQEGNELFYDERKRKWLTQG